MTCPVCRRRRPRRACPALGQQICSVCCGTKRQVEIACPADCAYLTVALEHPPAAVLRQRQRDVGVLVHVLRDFNQRQTDLFSSLTAALQQYAPPDVHPLIDADVIEAAGSLAATFETAARGVIYEHRPSSLPADRLAAALKPVILEAGRHGGAAFERDAAVVLRRLVEAATEVGAQHPSSRRGFVDLLGRVFKKREDAGPDDGHPESTRLIVP